MKRLTILFATLFLSVSLNAQSATKIYETKCAVCHKIQPMMDKTRMMKMTRQERMSMKQKMMKTMIAPPMNKVSAKLKDDFKNDKKAFVKFITNYIKNPSKTKAHCMPMALKRFGIMPPIGKAMSKKDINTIANWLYDNFTEKWNMNNKGMMCNTNKKSKCASGKCGSMMKKKKINKAEMALEHANRLSTGDDGYSEDMGDMKKQGKCGSN